MTILALLSRKSLRILILWLWRWHSTGCLHGILILRFPESASVTHGIPIVPVFRSTPGVLDQEQTTPTAALLTNPVIRIQSRMPSGSRRLCISARNPQMPKRSEPTCEGAERFSWGVCSVSVRDQRLIMRSGKTWIGRSVEPEVSTGWVWYAGRS